MIYCSHCEAENSPGAIFCQSCKSNLHYKGPPVQAEPSAEGGRTKRTPTAEELELERRIGRADAVTVVCGGIVLLAGAAFLFSLMVATSTPEGGFLGISIFAGAALASPVILILLGVMAGSISQSRAAGRELKELQARR